MIERGKLRRQLESMHPRDALERTHRAALLELLDLPGDVASREHYGPGHLTASAFVLSPDGAAVLLIYHSKLERWLQPGGHVEPTDASLLEAASREVREETGLRELQLVSAPFDVDVHEIPKFRGAPAHKHYDVRYLMRARDWMIPGGCDAHETRWFQRSSLSEVGWDESVRRAVRKMDEFAI